MFEFEFDELPETPAQGAPETGGQDADERAGGALFDFDDLPDDDRDEEPDAKDAKPKPGGAPTEKPEHAVGREAAPPADVRAQQTGQAAGLAAQAAEEGTLGVKQFPEEADDGEEEISMLFYMTLTYDQAGNTVTLPAKQGVRQILMNRQLVGESARRRGPPSAALFAHSDPDQAVKFGTWFGSMRAPVVFLEAPGPEVAEFIREDPDGPFAELDSDVRDVYWERWGFNEDRKETMLKMDWHSVPNLFTEGHFFIPRLAEGGQLQRAPPRIMAFVVAFRVVNKAIWASISDALCGLELARDTWVQHKVGENGLKRYKKTTHAKILSSLIAAFRSQRHFGVVEAQVRWGEEDHRMPSHKDGATSLLHLSITLGGRRRVWAGTFEASGSKAEAVAAPDGQKVDPEVNVYDEEVWQPPRLQQFEMTKGCTYVTAPFCFEHAVEYYASARSEPVIALQCRFGFPPDVGKLLNNLRTQEMLEISSVIAECLRASGAEGQLRMPTLNEVVQADAQLRAQLEENLGGQ